MPNRFISREMFPLRAATDELSDFSNGRILGPLSRVAMSLHDERMQLWQQIDPGAIDFPHYPLVESELRKANPLRDGKGEIVAWVPWRNRQEEMIDA